MTQPSHRPSAEASPGQEPGPRQRHREATTAGILERARVQLAEHGPAGLSLRKIARDMDLVSSAVYRYFPSRDDLLTRLIIDGYHEYGQAVEDAEAGVERSAFAERFRAAAGALRAWALANPNTYALIYGSPVPGYHAPQDTIAAASRAGLVLIRVLEDAAQSGHVFPVDGESAPPGETVAGLAEQLGSKLAPSVLAPAVDSWSHLMGLISFETFGQYRNMIADTDRFYSAAVSGALVRFDLRD